MTDPASQWLPLVALVTLGVIGVVGAFFLMAGMFEVRSLVYREFGAYFLSPIAYIVFVVFLGVMGHLFCLALDLLNERGPRGIEYPMQAMFGDERFWLVYLFIPPLLTMRLFAEERNSGTLEMLMTAPLKDWQVVLAKYLACLAFYVLLWLPTLIYLPALLGLQSVQVCPVWNTNTILAAIGLGMIVVSGVMSMLSFVGTRGHVMALLIFVLGAGLTWYGVWNHYHHDDRYFVSMPAQLDPAPVACSYLGLALAGAMFLAIGLLISSMVRNQLIAALMSLVIGLGFILTGFWKPDLDPGTMPGQIVYYFSVPMHFGRDFGRGLIDTRHLVLYASVAVACLFFTVRSLESRRWR